MSDTIASLKAQLAEKDAKIAELEAAAGGPDSKRQKTSNADGKKALPGLYSQYEKKGKRACCPHLLPCHTLHTSAPRPLDRARTPLFCLPHGPRVLLRNSHPLRRLVRAEHV
jgi:hypothetical protein